MWKRLCQSTLQITGKRRDYDILASDQLAINTEKFELEHYLRPYTDINFCWTAKIISKNFKENVGKYSCHMTGQGFSRQSIKCANYKRKNGHIKPQYIYDLWFITIKKVERHSMKKIYDTPGQQKSVI